jgi:hypothetical protein
LSFVLAAPGITCGYGHDGTRALETSAPVCRSPLQERNQLHVSRTHKDGKPFSPLLVRQQQTAPFDPQMPVLARLAVSPVTL